MDFINESLQIQKDICPISWKDVDIKNGLLGDRQKINSNVTIPLMYNRFEETKRIESLKMQWKQGEPNMPHPFWDSDIGKFIEAASYSLAKSSDPLLETQIDEIIDLIEKSQEPNGYFNTFYTVVDPGNSWTNLYYMHELYCAGHLIEGAVAYYLSTGKNKFLNIMCKYADHIDKTFGKEESKIHGYCGHPEIELALVKLYKVTGEERYLKLSKYFVDERGTQPYFFELESLQRGVDTTKTANQKRHLKYYLKSRGPYAEYQAHKPLKDQDEPVGHAVRAMYIYSAMTDLSRLTDDEELWKACQRIWEAVTSTQMYITGGIGPSSDGERFTFAYDLPNEYTYNETCASVGLVMWAHRMLQLTGSSKYADIMEQTLYNTVLSSVSIAGDKFFYANYLNVFPDRFMHASAAMIDKTKPERQEWFDVACCPPNVSRLISSIGEYFYSIKDNGLMVHLYNNSSTTFMATETQVSIEQQTNYPWDGNVRIKINPDNNTSFKLYLRKPAWCKHASVLVNGEDIEPIIENGYMVIDRCFSKGDQIDLRMDISIQKIHSNPAVRENCGRVALMRGPVVYCFEERDNCNYINDLSIDADVQITEQFESDLLGGVVTLSMEGHKRDLSQWANTLYSNNPLKLQSVPLKAIPYYTWCNRGLGEMLVWINER